MKKIFLTRTKYSRDDWETPPYLFNILNSEFHFTLDACASKETAKCEKYYTIEDNGLTKNWEGETVFCNPPYYDIKLWCEKCYNEGMKDNTMVVMLIPSRTDTKYWHNYIMKAGVIYFLKGRVNFFRDGVQQKGTNFPSCIVVFNGRTNAVCKTLEHKTKDKEHIRNKGNFIMV